MKVIDILNQKKVTLSFEVFPPKTTANYSSVEAATERIAALKPDFMSVTYGAGGGTSEYTLNIAKNLKEKYGTDVIPHLTCVSSSRDHVQKMINLYKEKGFENIMALRGDIPEGGRIAFDYTYASELITDIRNTTGNDFCIGGACYPEVHPDSATKDEDIDNLKRKIDAGCEFLTTQMFYDNSILYNFLYRISKRGINVPVLAGIMPITNAKQVARTVAMSGTQLPSRFISMVDKFGHDPASMKQVGIIYATEQIVDLIANDVNHIHVYTMNKPEIAEGILNNISELLK